MGLLQSMADTRTLDRYIYATFTFINTQLLERRLCVVLCIYVFTTRIPRASQQGFAAYQAFVLLYTPQPTMLVGVALGSFFMGGDRDRERER
jgi:hypothetical protein